MPQSRDLNFANRDLRNRSFRGQDLSGTDFSGCDLRGCDFRNTRLVGANFEGVRTGQSLQQILGSYFLIFISSLISLTVYSSILCFLFLILEKFYLSPGNIEYDYYIEKIYSTISILLRVDNAGDFGSLFSAFISLISFIIIGFLLFYPIALAANVSRFFCKFIISTTFRSLSVLEFHKNRDLFSFMSFLSAYLFLISNVYDVASAGKISDKSLFGYWISFIISLGIPSYCLVYIFKKIRNSLGTSFFFSDLSDSRFNNANLVNTNFADSKLDRTDLFGAKLTNCRLDLGKHLVKLCQKREGQFQDYQSVNFSKLNLRNTVLRKSDFKMADLSKTDLSFSSLEEANLSSVRALGTDFSGATMTGACIEDWAINAETKFTYVRCDYIYLRQNKQERRPESGFFRPGDFARLIATFSETLDLIFREGDDPEAFWNALRKLLEENRDADLSIQSMESLGQGEGRVRLNANNPQANKAQLREEFDRNYEILSKQLQAEREKTVALNKKLAYQTGQLTAYKQQKSFLEKLVYYQTERFSRPGIQANTAHFSGDVMAEQGNKIQFGDVDGNISGVAGGDLNGTVAGGNLSGIVRQTLGQLQDTPDPEAAQVADLLAQLQTAIDSEATALTARDKDNALKHLQTIGEAAQDRQNPSLRERAEDSLDALTGILGKANNLWAAAKPWLNGVRRLFGFLLLG